MPTDAALPAAVPGTLPGAELERLRQQTAAALRGSLGFPPLPGTKKEVERIAEQYGRARGDEPAPVVLEGTEASIVIDTAFQSLTAEDLTGSEIGISESISVITNIKHSPATTPTRRSKPGLIESGGPRLWTMLITNANIACVPT